MENESGVSGVSGDSQKEVECRNDEEMVEIETEIDDNTVLHKRSRDDLKLVRLVSRELPIESKSLLPSSEMESHSRNYDLPPKIVQDAFAETRDFDATHLLKNKCPRKQRKIATISVLKALEEDAPGLLQLLHENGIEMSEIKLFGKEKSDDDSCSKGGSFSEFESLMSKLFPHKPSLSKLPPLRSSANSEKKTYYLACLVALVEQSRYLVERKWPVEWGWCRYLKSFIFVFRRHNRVVLERPEYGYATYFFHLLKQLPIKWQIDRLVIAMKFTNRSRLGKIENKSKTLKIGDDLSEGEANVLKGYGWTVNTGLASTLNYLDRTVHTRFKEYTRSEWKEKIVNMLTDALTGGYIVLSESDIPKKALEYLEAFGPDEEDEEA